MKGNTLIADIFSVGIACAAAVLWVGGAFAGNAASLQSLLDKGGDVRFPAAVQVADISIEGGVWDGNNAHQDRYSLGCAWAALTKRIPL